MWNVLSFCFCAVYFYSCSLFHSCSTSLYLLFPLCPSLSSLSFLFFLCLNLSLLWCYLIPAKEKNEQLSQTNHHQWRRLKISTNKFFPTFKLSRMYLPPCPIGPKTLSTVRSVATPGWFRGSQNLGSFCLFRNIGTASRPELAGMTWK